MKFIKRLLAIWEWLVEPRDTSIPPEERYMARMLASISVIFFPLAFLFGVIILPETINPENPTQSILFYVGLSASLGYLLMYYLVISNHLLAAKILVTMIAFLGSWIIGFDEPYLVSYIFFSLLFAMFFFSGRVVWLIAILNLFSVLILHLISPISTLAATSFIFSFLTFLSVSFLLFSGLQKNQEEYRQASLKTANEELRKNQAELRALAGELEIQNVSLIKARNELEANVTERTKDLHVATKEAESANQAKSNFLASMSHELRTPLNAIIGFSELLGTQSLGTLNPKQSRHVSNILTSGDHLLALINEILDISKIEAGKLELDLSEIDIGTALKSVIARMRPLANKKDIRISLESADDLPLITVDPQRFDQIIYNLLSNAIKFTRQDGKVGMSVATVGDSQMQIRVQDSGIGILPENLAKVFEAFGQIDTSYAREQEGTGLGLALTRQLVQLHGGRIQAESAGEDRGSVFTIQLPLSGELEAS